MAQILATVVTLLIINFSSISAQGAEGTTTAFFSTKYAFILGAASQRCIGVSAASTADGAAAVIFDCLVTATNEHYSESAYKHISNDEEYHYLTNRKSGKCMAVAENSTANRAAIIQSPCAGDTFDGSQLFTKVPSSQAGFYQLKGLTSQKCLSIAGAATINSSPVLTFDCKDQTNQQFKNVYTNF